MLGLEIALSAFLVVALMFAGLWIPLAVGSAGLIIMYLEGGTAAFRAMGLITWGTLSSFTLTALPLFVLMAEILTQAGVGGRFFSGMALLVRRLPGGLLQTNILGSALFASICGSSAATAASLGSVALPQLEAREYDPSLSCGSLAAGGTLGILIPPSLTMIIYGTVTETSIAKLFIAGVIPGIVLAVLFSIYVGVRAILDPKAAPRDDEPSESGGVLFAIWQILPFTALMLIVLGTIYLGISTPTESAALGCVFAAIIALLFGKFNFRTFTLALQRTIETSAALLFIILGAFFFSYGIELGGISQSLVTLVTTSGFGAFGFLVLLMAIYIVLGCFLDGAGMIVLTVPLLQPVLAHMGIDLIWFGVFVVLMLEIGMLTPPFGLNLFVVQSASKWQLGTIVVGTLPFIAIMIAFVFVLMAFPQIALWLPSRI